MEKLHEQFRIHRLPAFPLGEMAQDVLSARMAGRDIIDLGQVNPQLPPPSAAVDKLVQTALQTHNHRYSSSQGITKLRQTIAAWYEKRFRVGLDSDSEVVVTMGTKEGLSHLLLALSNSGDSMMVPLPCYPIHSAAISLAGANIIGVPLPLTDGSEPGELTEKSESFFHELEKAYENSWPRPVLMVVSFPHNPTSTVVTSGFFDRLVHLARDRGFLLVHDFSYADLGFNGYKPPSILASPGAKEVAVEFCSYSKGLNMPGWRIGFCAGNERLISALKKIKSYLDCGPFQPLQIAAITGLQVYEQTLIETAEIYRDRRDVFCSGLKELGWNFITPKAGLYVWAEIPAAMQSGGSMRFSKQLLSEYDIASSPGIGFGKDADHYVRFALLEPEPRLRLALTRLRKMSA